jgi:hypothetical protein
MINDKSRIDYYSLTDMITSENNQMDKNKSEKYSVKYYSCKECGNTIDVDPPDHVHRFSSVYPCWKFDWIKRKYGCSSCSKTTTLYWHSEVHKYRDYATAEVVALKMNKAKLDESIKKRMARY